MNLPRHHYKPESIVIKTVKDCFARVGNLFALAADFILADKFIRTITRKRTFKLHEMGLTEASLLWVKDELMLAVIAKMLRNVLPFITGEKH